MDDLIQVIGLVAVMGYHLFWAVFYAELVRSLYNPHKFDKLMLYLYATGFVFTAGVFLVFTLVR